MEQSFEHIGNHTILEWAESFLIDLKRTHDPQGCYIKTGFGLNWQIVKTKRGFKELEAQTLEDQYEETKKRVFIFY